VKDLKAMDDYEEAIKASEASLTRKATTDYIMRKWTKPHLQRYIKSLMPSSDLTINMTTLANIMKRHQVDGEKLIHLSKDILMDMAIPEQAAVWLMEQFEELFNNQSTYPLRV
jgi:3-methyladenine DNA glycosylase AlkC